MRAATSRAAWMLLSGLFIYPSADENGLRRDLDRGATKMPLAGTEDGSSTCAQTYWVRCVCLSLDTLLLVSLGWCYTLAAVVSRACSRLGCRLYCSHLGCCLSTALTSAVAVTLLLLPRVLSRLGCLPRLLSLCWSPPISLWYTLLLSWHFLVSRLLLSLYAKRWSVVV